MRSVIRQSSPALVLGLCLAMLICASSYWVRGRYYLFLRDAPAELSFEEAQGESLNPGTVRTPDLFAACVSSKKDYLVGGHFPCQHCGNLSESLAIAHSHPHRGPPVLELVGQS